MAIRTDLPKGKEGIPVVIAADSINIFGVGLRCYILNNGERMINAADFHRVCEVMEGPDFPELDEAELTRLARFLHGSNQEFPNV